MPAWTFVEQLFQDVRYALRAMAANRLFTAMAVLSLALGIGANTAIFSFMDSILMRALPVPDPQSLVMLNLRSKDFPPIANSYSGSNFRNPGGGMTMMNLPYRSLEVFQKSGVLSTVFGFAGAGSLNVLIRGQAGMAGSQYVSGGFFSGIGAPPAAGRLIDATDDVPGGPTLAVLSYPYARKRFGDAARAVGQNIQIDNVPFSVIGVTAPEFFGVNPGGNTELFLPMQTRVRLDTFSENPAARFTDDHFYWLEIMGRLRPGATLAQAQAALAPRFQQWVETTATNDKERSDLPRLLVREGAGGLDFLRRQYSRPLYVLMTMVMCILAIACANIANLLLARSAARRHEMGLRLSLGAGRGRIIRQLLTESVLLAVIGALLGLVFTRWGIRFLTLLIANGRENFTLRAELNWNVLGVALALSVATGILFGLAPALQATRVDLASALKATRAGESRVRLRRWLPRISLSHMLVVAQVSICLVLLVAAGLFVRTLSKLNSVQLGFNRENLLLFDVNAKQAGYRDQALGRFYDDLRLRLASLPGVRGATSSSYALVSGSMSSRGFHIPGANLGRESTVIFGVGASFFSTMQIPILLGREIDERDQTSSAKVAVANEVFVKKYLGEGNPIGRRFGFGGGGSQPADIEIVGVSKTARLNSLKGEIRPAVYLPYGQDLRRLGGMTYEVRTAGDPLVLANTVRQAVRAADERIPVTRVISQALIIDQTISQERTFATLCTAFAVLAVLMACLGLYGTMAYTVARRTNEIGLRMALGARRGGLIWMVMRQVLAMVVIGLAIGLPVVWASAHLLEAYLFEMKPKDPLTMVVVPAILLLAALAAGCGPALRASRIDPWTALRHE